MILEKLFHGENLPILFGISIVVFLLFFEAGYRIARKRQASMDEATKAWVTAIYSAILAMLGLLLGFSYSMAQQRFELRRQLVVDEANAIGTTYLRAQWLPEPHRRDVAKLTKLSVDFLTLQKQGVFLGSATGMPTSIDNMNPNNWFVQHLAAIPIADGVVANSIVAVDSDAPLDEAGDGVVKYMSAHIDGVESEKIVRSGHSVQGNPEAILEVKRIMHEHAKGLPALTESNVSNVNK